MCEICVEEHNASSRLLLKSCNAGDWAGICTRNKFEEFLKFFYVDAKDIKLMGNQDQTTTASSSSVANEKYYFSAILFRFIQKSHRRDLNGDSNFFENLYTPIIFRPELCRYQKRSVQWMLRREKHPDYLQNFMKVLKCKDGVTEIHQYKYICRVSDKSSGVGSVLPAGGILADEMGLGKTVEILALIILNPFKANVQVLHTQEVNFRRYLCKKYRHEDDNELVCICSMSSSQGHSTDHSSLIACRHCNRLQHKHCVTKYDEGDDSSLNTVKRKSTSLMERISTTGIWNVDVMQPSKTSSLLSLSPLLTSVSLKDLYVCPDCWYNYVQQNGLIKTKATFIVTPMAIVQQWVSETYRHIQPPLRVLIYNGVQTDKWISPLELTTYDIVITNYNVLRKEIYFTDENVSNRLLRKKSKNLRIYTPLLMMEWWRVCLDEAQMVESDTSKMAALTRMIPGKFLQSFAINLFLYLN